MQQRREQRQQIARHLLIALRGRVYSVRLHAACRAINVLKQKGKQGHMVFPGKQCIGLVELTDVIRAIIRGQSNSTEHHFGSCALKRGDNLIEVAPRAVDRQSAQTIIPAEGNDDGRRFQREHFIQPVQTVFRRVAAYAGVHHMVVKALRFQIAFKKIWIAVAGICTVACSQAIAEGDNDRPIVGRLRLRLRCRSGRGGRGRRRRGSGLSFAAKHANT